MTTNTTKRSCLRCVFVPCQCFVRDLVCRCDDPVLRPFSTRRRDESWRTLRSDDSWPTLRSADDSWRFLRSASDSVVVVVYQEVDEDDDDDGDGGGGVSLCERRRCDVDVFDFFAVDDEDGNSMIDCEDGISNLRFPTGLVGGSSVAVAKPIVLATQLPRPATDHVRNDSTSLPGGSRSAVSESSDVLARSSLKPGEVVDGNMADGPPPPRHGLQSDSESESESELTSESQSNSLTIQPYHLVSAGTESVFTRREDEEPMLASRYGGREESKVARRYGKVSLVER